MNMSRFPLIWGVLLTVALFTGCQNKAPYETVETAPETPTAAQTGAATVAAIPLTPGKVKAGAGVDDIRIGQSKDEVFKSLGQPEEVDSNEFAPGQTYALFYSKGIELIFNNDKVEVITLHAEDAKWKAYTGATDQGLGVGSSGEDIIKALGEPAPDMPRALRYPKLGLWFRLDADRDSKEQTPRAESVQVLKPE